MKITWLSRPKEDDDGFLEDETRTTLGVQIIKWKEWHLQDSKSLWVPIQYNVVRKDIGTIPHMEYEGHVVWRELLDPNLFPAINDTEWTESTRKVFDENWKLSLDEWKRTFIVEDKNYYCGKVGGESKTK